MKDFIPELLTEKLTGYFSTDGPGLPARGDLDVRFTWNLNDIFPSTAEWEQAFEYVNAHYPSLQAYAGKLYESAGVLFEFLKKKEELEITLEKLFLYAMLSKDLDLSGGTALAMFDRVSALGSKFGSVLSFFRPEILNGSLETVEGFINTVPELGIYRRYFSVLFREKEHTLSREIEEVLAAGSELSALPYNVFSVLMNANITFPEVADENGQMITLSPGRYSASLYSKDRAFRERVYRAYYSKIAEFGATFATTLSGNLKAKIFSSKVRKYSSALEAALSPNEIPVSVYENLLATVDNHLKPLHRWIQLKARLQGTETISPFDMYVSHFPNPLDKKYTIEEGYALVLKACERLGEDYLTKLKTAFENRWLDVYETKGKRSGAYSSGTTFGVHPYVLLNWNGTLNDVFTLAHEMGHCLHSAYTTAHQPYIYADYTIFVAEVASTLNENLLHEYLVATNDDPAVKAFLLERFLNDMTATFYRQVMFAEFEKIIYETVEQGGALSAEDYGKLYCDIYKKYNGPYMLTEDEEMTTHSRIPHFYYNFYVYQYATGIAASLAITDRILSNGAPAVDDYLNFLKSGSSADAITLLQRAGVDMSTPEPIVQAINKMNAALDELEAVLPELGK